MWYLFLLADKMPLKHISRKKRLFNIIFPNWIFNQTLLIVVDIEPSKICSAWFDQPTDFLCYVFVRPSLTQDLFIFCRYKWVAHAEQDLCRSASCYGVSINLNGVNLNSTLVFQILFKFSPIQQHHWLWPQKYPTPPLTTGEHDKKALIAGL